MHTWIFLQDKTFLTSIRRWKRRLKTWLEETVEDIVHDLGLFSKDLYRHVPWYGTMSTIWKLLMMDLGKHNTHMSIKDNFFGRKLSDIRFNCYSIQFLSNIFSQLYISTPTNFEYLSEKVSSRKFVISAIVINIVSRHLSYPETSKYYRCHDHTYIHICKTSSYQDRQSIFYT